MKTLRPQFARDSQPDDESYLLLKRAKNALIRIFVVGCFRTLCSPVKRPFSISFQTKQCDTRRHL